MDWLDLLAFQGWGRLCCGAFYVLSAVCSRVFSCLFQSSLLRALLGELPPRQGKVSVHGRIAYVSQQPWVFPGTVRSNILFGKKYEEEWYEEVIRACALEEVSNDSWVACNWISNNDNIGLSSKICWKFFLFEFRKSFICCFKLDFWISMQSCTLLFWFFCDNDGHRMPLFHLVKFHSLLDSFFNGQLTKICKNREHHVTNPCVPTRFSQGQLVASLAGSLPLPCATPPFNAPSHPLEL